MLAECRMKIILTFGILSLSALSVNALAQVYRCTTPTGGTEFSQIPCGKDSKLIKDRANSIDTGPPTDPFGVQRERGRLESEAGYYRDKASSDMPTNGAGASSRLPAVRQIDAVACERADRDAHIESRSPRRDLAMIKRKQNLADWECGRTMPARESSAPAPSAPTIIPGATRNPNPILTNCDSAGCWDTNGGRYNRAAGNTFFGPNGVACTRTAAGTVCP